LLKACQDCFDYALKLSTGEIIRFSQAEIHGDYATLLGSPEDNTSLDGKKQGLPFVFDRGLDVRIANIIWCADAPEGS
jgi:hypothetical protein